MIECDVFEGNSKGLGQSDRRPARRNIIQTWRYRFITKVDCIGLVGQDSDT